jgi:pimeloyl-ACP methyl ester carboxylesterase
VAAALLVLTIQAVTPPLEAAIRYKRTGEATMGGADALAGVPAACELGGHHVWVEAEGRGECIAFYPTAGLEGASQAIFYFEGDIPADYRHNPQKLGAHLGSMRRALDGLAATYRIPYVFVARPGTFGSTGDHADRRKDREPLVMREAVDAIRHRYGLRHLSLAGQSGGATIAGALLTLGLSDVRCATPASGGFDLNAMLDWHAQRQGIVGRHREHPASLAGSYNVMERIGGISRDQDRRVFIIGDSADKVTPFSQQRRFAERLKEQGHHAELVEATGSGPDRHGLTFMSLKIAGLCATGASDAEIRRASSQ